ncbi:hypothetical protein KKC08_04595 [Patescibacteria group bacterium]|nr:hypothetical protein [Patescibacteria group bacterium]MCG2702377.1 hypothetical protein [Candidatus Parcubacteria bacterium]MBU4210382.1 hypothetical protein [Patescibacteria group bacterium]MBU4264852.1 hypothetical protein [Patescibacteria group bacterium]MBU4389723.1 hypothetical protein [Patescibacteria group bacterium]
MNKTQQKYLKNSDKYKQLVWEYNISPQIFFNILNGKETQKWFNRQWATTKVLENATYYDAINLIDMDYLKKNWNIIKSRIFNKSIKNGYQFVLQKKALSSSR